MSRINGSVDIKYKNSKLQTLYLTLSITTNGNEFKKSTNNNRKILTENSSSLYRKILQFIYELFTQLNDTESEG